MERTFESSLAELEKIVEQLENGDLPLEQSLDLFERGVGLSRECRKRLTDAERRIEMLMKDGDGKLSLTELPSDDSGEPSPSAKKRYVFGDEK